MEPQLFAPRTPHWLGCLLRPTRSTFGATATRMHLQRVDGTLHSVPAIDIFQFRTLGRLDFEVSGTSSALVFFPGLLRAVTLFFSHLIFFSRARRSSRTQTGNRL